MNYKLYIFDVSNKYIGMGFNQCESAQAFFSRHSCLHMNDCLTLDVIRRLSDVCLTGRTRVVHVISKTPERISMKFSMCILICMGSICIVFGGWGKNGMAARAINVKIELYTLSQKRLYGFQ